MKKSTFLFLSLFIAFTAFSQNYHQQDQFIFDGTPDDRFFDPFQSPTQRQGVLKNATKAMDNVVSKPDSVIGYNFDKETGDSTYSTKTTYEYDEYGNESLVIGYTWEDNEKAWINNYKNNYIYDEHGNNLFYGSYNWENEKWELSYSFDYKYNNNNKATSLLYTLVYSSNDTLVEKTNFKYNTDKLDYIANRFQWDGNSGTWLQTEIRKYYYDKNDNDSLWIYEDYENQVIIGGTKSLFNYIDDQINYRIGSNWDPEMNEYIYYSKSEHSFDESGNETINYYKWSTDIGDWKLETKEEKYFNSQGQQTDWKHYEIDENTNIVYPYSSRTEVQYNSYNDRILIVYYRGDTTTQDNWRPNKKNEIQRNNEGTIFSELVSYYDKNNSEWYKAKTMYYYYNGGLLSVNTAKENIVKLYPNPATEYIFIENLSSGKPFNIEIYSLSGALCKKIKSTTEVIQIPIEEMKSGIYLLKVESANNFVTQRIIIY